MSETENKILDAVASAMKERDFKELSQNVHRVTKLVERIDEHNTKAHEKFEGHIKAYELDKILHMSELNTVKAKVEKIEKKDLFDITFEAARKNPKAATAILITLLAGEKLFEFLKFIIERYT